MQVINLEQMSIYIIEELAGHSAVNFSYKELIRLLDLFAIVNRIYFAQVHPAKVKRSGDLGAVDDIFYLSCRDVTKNRIADKGMNKMLVWSECAAIGFSKYL